MNCIRMWGFNRGTYQYILRCWLHGEEHEAEPDGPSIDAEAVWAEPGYFVDRYGIGPELIERTRPE